MANQWTYATAKSLKCRVFLSRNADPDLTLIEARPNGTSAGISRRLMLTNGTSAGVWRHQSHFRVWNLESSCVFSSMTIFEAVQQNLIRSLRLSFHDQKNLGVGWSTIFFFRVSNGDLFFLSRNSDPGLALFSVGRTVTCSAVPEGSMMSWSMKKMSESQLEFPWYIIYNNSKFQSFLDRSSCLLWVDTAAHTDYCSHA